MAAAMEERLGEVVRLKAIQRLQRIDSFMVEAAVNKMERAARSETGGQGGGIRGEAEDHGQAVGLIVKELEQFAARRRLALHQSAHWTFGRRFGSP